MWSGRGVNWRVKDEALEYAVLDLVGFENGWESDGKRHKIEV